MAEMYHYLNDVAALRAMDNLGLLKYTARIGDHVDQALYLMTQFFLPPHFPVPKKLLLLGTDSHAGVVSDIVLSMYGHMLPISVQVCNSALLPGWVDRHTVVLALSVSGNTPEVLAAYQAALERQAKVIVVSTGGTLGREADNRNQAFIQLPAEPLMKHGAWPFFLIPVLDLLARLDLIAPCRKELEQCLPFIDKLSETYQAETPKEQNLAKEWACKLFEQIPVVYSADTWCQGVARHWKQQLCQNGKIMSHFNTVPQLNHNESQGWEGPAKILSQLQPILIRDTVSESALQKQQMEQLARQLQARLHRPVLQIHPTGDSVWERLFSFLVLGDWLSLYVAMLYRVNPVSPVKAHLQHT